jgi:hypothetical protein
MPAEAMTVSGAGGAGEQAAPVAGGGLGEDRLEVVLDGAFETNRCRARSRVPGIGVA